jgi:hypothetical protein
MGKSTQIGPFEISGLMKIILFILFSTILPIIAINSFIVFILNTALWVNDGYSYHPDHSIFFTSLLSLIISVYYFTTFNHFKSKKDRDYIYIIAVTSILLSNILPDKVSLPKYFQGYVVIDDNSVHQDAYCFKYYCKVPSNIHGNNVESDRDFYSYRWAKVTSKQALFDLQSNLNCCKSTLDTNEGFEKILFPIKTIAEISFFNLFPSIFFLIPLVLIFIRLKRLHFSVDDDISLGITIGFYTIIAILALNYIYYTEILNLENR